MITIEQMKKIKENICWGEGDVGIEREGLRCDHAGHLAYSPHPAVFGEKLGNPYITTDFSESQMELITPAFASAEGVYNCLSNLYDLVVLEIGDEYIWPQSMPCVIPKGKQIPIAHYEEGDSGKEAEAYRKMLLEKYGGKKQLLSGIHYNFSFEEKLIEGLYALEERTESYREFRDQVYLKVARNYLRYRWLLIYLLGSTSVMHESYIRKCLDSLEDLTEDSYTNNGALSYRNTDCGYANKTDLFPNYESVAAYRESLERFMEEELIKCPKELYSQVRLKAKSPEGFLDSLEKDGIRYLEYRSIDINPFDKAGISLHDLHFLHLFNYFLLLAEESDHPSWQQEALANQRTVAKFGQNQVDLMRDGEWIDKTQWGIIILNEMREISETLSLGYSRVLDTMEKKLTDYTLTYAYQIMQAVKEKGYIAAHLSLAKRYKEAAYANRFKLKGYEDMELSTQILMKEAMKQGIKVEVLDQIDNFISLKKGDKVTYVKQATKTALDNYVTVLAMENKVVTKHLLEKAGIEVPQGEDYSSERDALQQVARWVGRPLVVKPKSTNFGLGISIFPEGGALEDLQQAVKIAFKEDETVLIETFIPGKEYRFLVIGEEVVGILHRVPANVLGDGAHTIEELVATKNQDPLRGKGYKTPLEKIQLDESALLFLKQQGLSAQSIPSKGEIVYLRENSNISTGGDSVDYTEEIDASYKQLAVAATKAVGAVICGVDMMIPSITTPNGDYSIIEVNFNPAIHIHSFPYKGKERNIAAILLKQLGF